MTDLTYCFLVTVWVVDVTSAALQRAHRRPTYHFSSEQELSVEKASALFCMTIHKGHGVCSVVMCIGLLFLFDGCTVDANSTPSASSSVIVSESVSGALSASDSWVGSESNAKTATSRNTETSTLVHTETEAATQTDSFLDTRSISDSLRLSATFGSSLTPSNERSHVTETRSLSPTEGSATSALTATGWLTGTAPSQTRTHRSESASKAHPSRTGTILLPPTPTQTSALTPSSTSTPTSASSASRSSTVATFSDSIQLTLTASLAPTRSFTITTTEGFTDTSTILLTATKTASDFITLTITVSDATMSSLVTESELVTITESLGGTASHGTTESSTLPASVSMMPDMCSTYGAPTWILTTSFVSMGVRERRVHIALPPPTLPDATTTFPTTTNTTTNATTNATAPAPTHNRASSKSPSVSRSHTATPAPVLDTIKRRLFEHTYQRHIVYVPGNRIQEAILQWLVPASEVFPHSDVFPERDPITLCPRCQGTGLQRLISLTVGNSSDALQHTHVVPLYDAVLFGGVGGGAAADELTFFNESALLEAIGDGDVSVSADGRYFRVRNSSVASRIRSTVPRGDLAIDRLPAAPDALREQEVYLRSTSTPLSGLLMKPPGETGFDLGQAPLRRRVRVPPSYVPPAEPSAAASGSPLFLSKSAPMVKREEWGVTFTPTPTSPSSLEPPPYVTPLDAHTVSARDLWSKGMLLGLNVLWDSSGDSAVGASGRGGAGALRTVSKMSGGVNDGPMYADSSAQGSNGYSVDTERLPPETSFPAPSPLDCPLPSAPKRWADATAGPAPRASSVYALCAGIYRNVPLVVRTVYDAEATRTAASSSYLNRDKESSNTSVARVFRDLVMDSGVAPYYVSDLAATIFVPFDVAEDAGEAALRYDNQSQVEAAMRDFKPTGFPEGHLDQCIPTNTSVVWLYIRPRNRRLPLFRTSTLSLNLFGVGADGGRPVLTVVQQLLLRSGALLKRKMGIATLSGLNRTATADSNSTLPPSVVSCNGDKMGAGGREQLVAQRIVGERALGRTICTSFTEGDGEVRVRVAVAGNSPPRTRTCDATKVTNELFPRSGTRQFLAAQSRASDMRDLPTLDSSGTDLEPNYLKLPTMTYLKSTCSDVSPFGQWALLRAATQLQSDPVTIPRSSRTSIEADGDASPRAALYELQSLTAKEATPKGVAEALYAAEIAGGMSRVRSSMAAMCSGGGCASNGLQFRLLDAAWIADGSVVSLVPVVFHSLGSIPLVDSGRLVPDDWYFNATPSGSLVFDVPTSGTPECGGTTDELDLQALNPLRRLLATPWSSTAVDAHNFRSQLYKLRGDGLSAILSIAVDLFKASGSGTNSTNLITSTALNRELLPDTMYYSIQAIQSLEVAFSATSVRQWFNIAPAWSMPWVASPPANAPFQRALGDTSGSRWGPLVDFLASERPSNSWNEALANMVATYKGYATNAEEISYLPTWNALRCAANTLPGGMSTTETYVNGSLRLSAPLMSSFRYQGPSSPNPNLLELEDYQNRRAVQGSRELSGLGGDQFLLSFVVLGEAPPIPDVLTEAALIGPYVALFLVSLLRSPLLLFLQTRSADLAGTSMCEAGSHTPLHVVVSPLQLSLGTGGARYFRGGLVGNAILFVGCTVGLLLLGFLIHRPRAKAAVEIAERHSRMVANRKGVRTNVLLALSALSKKGTTFTPLLSRTEEDIPFRVPSYGDSLLSLRVPGVLYVLIGALLYGTAVCSAGLIAHAESAFDVLLGVIGITLLAAAVVGAAIMLQTVKEILHVMPEVEVVKTAGENRRIVQRLIEVIRFCLVPRTHWVMRGLMSAQSLPATADILESGLLQTENLSSPDHISPEMIERTVTGGTSARLFLHGRRMYAHLYSDIGTIEALHMFTLEMVVTILIGLLQGMRHPDFFGGWGFPSPHAINSVLVDNLNLPHSVAQRTEVPTAAYSSIASPPLQGLTYFAFDDPSGPFMQLTSSASKWLSSLSDFGPMSIPICTLCIGAELAVHALHLLAVLYFALRYRILQTPLLSATYVTCVLLLVLSSVGALMSRIAYLTPADHSLPAIPHREGNDTVAAQIASSFWSTVVADNDGSNPYAFLFDAGGDAAYADLFGWLFVSQLGAVCASLFAGTKVVTDLVASVLHVRHLIKKRKAESAAVNVSGEAIPDGMDPDMFHQLHELKRGIMNGTVTVDADALTDDQAELLRDPAVLKYLYADDLRSRVALRREHALQRALNRSKHLRDAIDRHEEWMRKAERRRDHATSVSDLMFDDLEDGMPRPPPSFWREQLLVLPQSVRQDIIAELQRHEDRVAEEDGLVIDHSAASASSGSYRHANMDLLLQEMEELDDIIDKEQAAIHTLQQLVGENPLSDRLAAKLRADEKSVAELREVLLSDTKKPSVAEPPSTAKSEFRKRIEPLSSKPTVHGGLPPPHSVLRFDLQRKPPNALDIL